MLLTRAPLVYPPKGALPFDLHVLSTPPAFVLSQDQTLQFEPFAQALHAFACNTQLFGVTPRSTEAQHDVTDRKYVPIRLFEPSQTRETARYSVFKDRAKPLGTCTEPLGRTRNLQPEPGGLLLISRRAEATEVGN